MIWVIAIPVIIYIVFIVFLIAAPVKKVDNGKKQTPFALIIPFKEFSGSLLGIIKIINSYSSSNSFQVILVNDYASKEDLIKIQQVLHDYTDERVTLLSNTSQKGKKTAIETGVNYSEFDKIVTLDSDCEITVDWLEEIFFLSVNSQLNVGVVEYKRSGNWIAVIQYFESIMLNLITVKMVDLQKPVLASGANICYSKKTFLEGNPYANNKHIPSGDDMFLLGSFSKLNLNYNQIRNSVITDSKESLKDWLAQHIRWASKTTKVGLPLLSVIGGIVFLAQLASIFSILYFLLTGSFIFLLILTAKWLAEILAILFSKNQIKRYYLLLYSPLVSLIYPFLMLIIFIGTFLKGKDW